MKKLLKNKDLLYILLILIISSFLRLYRIADYLTFLGDEGRDVLVVYNILHGNLTLLGPTASVGGFFMGPLYYYFMVPFLWLFGYNPVGPAVMVALFGIATVWLIYKIGSEFFDKKAALLASALYAISPLVITYSRSSWNPNLMPFFSLLMVYILYKAVNKSSRMLFVFAGFSYGILLELHYVVTFLAPVIIVYIILIRFVLNKNLIFKKTVMVIKDLSFFTIGILGGLFPLLLFEVRHGFLNTQSILKFVFHSGETGGSNHFLSMVWDVFFRLFGRLIMKFPPPEQISSQASTTIIDLYFAVIKLPIIYLYFATVLLALASVGIFLIKYIKTIKKKNEDFQKLTILALWLFFGVIVFGFYKKSIYDYYLEFMFPLPFLLVGNLLSKISTKRWGVLTSFVIFIAIVVLNLTGLSFRYQPNKQLAQVEKISRFVFDKAGGKPFNLALITGGNSDHAYRYFLTIWNHPSVIIENTQVDPQRKTVTDQLLIICETNPCSPLGNSLWEVSGFGRGEIVGEWEVSVVKVYKLVHYNPKK